MNPFAFAGVLILAILQFLFMILEMFIWRRPLGKKIFPQSRNSTKLLDTLMSNQGLYNGCFSAGLAASLMMPPPAAYPMQIYLCLSVLVVGLYGWYTVSRSILFVQALPALAALALVIIFPV